MKNKGFFAGMLTMLLIISLVGTAAATYGKVTKELEYRDIGVTLDGKKLDLKDAAGNSVEPFMFEGTNYLPVRAMAETLGLNVSWDGAASTVVLTSEPKYYKNTKVSMLENVVDAEYVQKKTPDSTTYSYLYTLESLPESADSYFQNYVNLLLRDGFKVEDPGDSALGFLHHDELKQSVFIDIVTPKDGFDDFYFIITIMV